MKQGHFGRGCGQIIRTAILHAQELEAMEVVEKTDKG
jgi:hypothetical protein